MRIYLQLYEQVLGEKAMAKRADVIAKADTPEVACLVCCLVQLAATRVTMAACLVAETHYYSLTVLAGHDGRDHARDYEQPPTGACSKKARVSIMVPHATPITLPHSHTTAYCRLGTWSQMRTARRHGSSSGFSGCCRNECGMPWCLRMVFDHSPLFWRGGGDHLHA